MAGRNPSKAVAPASVIPGVHPQSDYGVFAEWLDRERVSIPALASELGVTASYVRMLRSRAATPGARLRLRIQERTGGAVRFDDW